MRVRNIFICSGVVFCASSRMMNDAVERPSAHEREGGDLDGALLQEALGAVGPEHVVERVVERAQVRVDLRHEVPGQEAEPLARLDRGSREHDPAGPRGAAAPGRRRRRRGSSCRCPAGPMREGDRVRRDRVGVALLARGVRPDGLALLAAQDVLAEDLGGAEVLSRTMHDRALDLAHVEVLAALEQQQQLVEELRDDRRLRPGRAQLGRPTTAMVVGAKACSTTRSSSSRWPSRLDSRFGFATLVTDSVGELPRARRCPSCSSGRPAHRSGRRGRAGAGAGRTCSRPCPRS